MNREPFHPSARAAHDWEAVCQRLGIPEETPAPDDYAHRCEATLRQRRERTPAPRVVDHQDAPEPAQRRVLASGHGNPPPRREKGQGVAPTLESGTNRSGGPRPPGSTVDTVASPLRSAGPGAARVGDSRGQDTVVVSPPLTRNPYGDHESREGLLVAAVGGNRQSGPLEVATACNAKGGSGRMDFETETFVAHTLRGEGFDASEDGTGRGTPRVACLQSVNRGEKEQNGAGIGEETAYTLNARDQHAVAFTQEETPKHGVECRAALDAVGSRRVSVAVTGCETPKVSNEVNGSLRAAREGYVCSFQERGREGGTSLDVGGDTAYALTAPAGGGRRQEMNIATPAAVRRLTPTECEILQGFPVGHTCLCGQNEGRSWPPDEACRCADGPRYRALGNAVAVPVVTWILRQIVNAEPSPPPTPWPCPAPACPGHLESAPRRVEGRGEVLEARCGGCGYRWPLC